MFSEARKHIIIELALITDWSSKLVQLYDEMETAQEYLFKIINTTFIFYKGFIQLKYNLSIVL